MSKQITLTLERTKVVQWIAITEEGFRRVEVSYNILTDTGEVYDSGLAIFWESMPEQPENVPPGLEGEWYEIPSGHMQNLVSLTQDIQTFLDAQHTA